jgi:hypothetical protein
MHYALAAQHRVNPRSRLIHLRLERGTPKINDQIASASNRIDYLNNLRRSYSDADEDYGPFDSGESWHQTIAYTTGP